MPNFGLSKPWIAKYNPNANSYSDAFKCGKAMNTAVTPNHNEATLFADNQPDETVSEFKNANVTLGVNTMPLKAALIMFGHTIKEDGTEIHKSSDSASYVGYGFIVAERTDGEKKYRACVLRKVLFKEGEESYETKGDSIVFKTPSISGTALPVDDGEWRVKSPIFDTEDEADLWIQKKFNVKEQCKIPVSSVPGGEYTTAQSVTLLTATAGAKIRYTTDGTTPSATNGTEYKGSISISQNTGLRAVAYKEDADPSDVMTEEYFIVTE